MEDVRFVVDTNVLAYYLLGVKPYRNEISALLHKNVSWIAPQSLKPELLNVLWLAVKGGSISLEQGLESLSLAAALVQESVPIDGLWSEALIVAMEKKYSPYDVLFVVLAERRKTKLLTYDHKLLRSFPKITRTPGRAKSR